MKEKSRGNRSGKNTRRVSGKRVASAAERHGAVAPRGSDTQNRRTGRRNAARTGNYSDSARLREQILSAVLEPGYIPSTPEKLAQQLGEQDPALLSYVAGLLAAEGKISVSRRGALMPPQPKAVLHGIFRGNTRGFGFVVPDEDEDWRSGDLHISQEYTGGAIDGDSVTAEVTETADNRGRRNEGRVVTVTARALTEVIGTVAALPRTKGQPRRYEIIPDDRRLSFTVQIDPDIAGSEPPREGEKVAAAITRYPGTSSGSVWGRITQSFGESGTRGANYEAILHEHGITVDFPPEVIAEAEQAARRPINADGRLDLRDKVIFTIDGADAKDLDDAISVERAGDGYLLGVHIADVSEYVTAGSAVDIEASERGTSVYFTDKVVPMLPVALSNGSCSLGGGLDRLTLSAMMTLDARGNIVTTELRETVIRSRVRGVYSELNDLLENGENSPYYEKYLPVASALPVVTELYEKLAALSRSRGSLELDTAEAQIILDGSGAPTDIRRRERGKCERIIEQFMLCANEGVAQRLCWADMPCVYRIHEDPSPEKIHVFELFAHNLGLDITPLRAKKPHVSAFAKVLAQAEERGLGGTVSYILLRSMMRARYSAAPSPHFGLATERYCHFTSPIRRYPDLAVHRIVKAYLHGILADGPVLEMFNSFAASTAVKSSECEVRATEAERDIEDLYKTIYMAGHVGETFPAVVSSVTSFGFFAELENTCEGLVPISSLDGYFEYNEEAMSLSCGRRSYSVGDFVTVRLTGADIISRRLNFEIVGGEVK